MENKEAMGGDAKVEETIITRDVDVVALEEEN
jgi:hypothetical protein